MSMDKGLDTGNQPNGSSDFVRKLFKMLEDPTYREIVRWADGGETFVVLENEKFTKTVLPKHFKHSNFASFVRQLNKYDFHKVRQNSEDNTPALYGPNAWEFKHPEFQEHKKDLLDNIKRKAPAPRKPQPNAEDSFPSQQLDLLNSQLVASQQQIQQLSENYNALSQSQVKLIQQIVQLQKLVRNHEEIMQRVIYCIGSQRGSGQLGYGSGLGNGDIPNNSTTDDNVASSLQEAHELLREFSAKNLSDKELEQMTNNFQQRNEFSVPRNDPPTNQMALQPTSQSIGYLRSNDVENLVYPVGNTEGIDPIHSEHIHNIPYAPSTNLLLQNPLPEMISETSIASNSKKVGMEKSIWGERKPMILLVEDDKICVRIGVKFLLAFDCSVETACNGMEAVTKVNNGPISYDLILMDIIMPKLDGVSATVCIKEFRPHLPIIAMTSNIRADDIHMYFSHGMDDVLPKPFTKEGMLRALEKHLLEKKKPVFQSPNQIPHPGEFRNSTSSHSSLNIDIGQLQTSQLKTEILPEKATSSWDPSNQLALPSPASNPPRGFMRQTIGDQFNNINSLPQNQTSLTNFAPRQPSSAIIGQQNIHKRTRQQEIQNLNSDNQAEKRQRTFSHPPADFAL